MEPEVIQGRSVLIVDDAPENLRLLVNVLKHAGLVPRPVANGRLALEAATVDPPDLVLLDVNMPGVSGFDVCRQFKRDQRLRHIPVVFISGLQGTDEKVEAFAVGGVDFISKPFQELEVLARVKTHLELRSLHEALESQNLVLTREQRRTTARLEALSRAARDALVMLDADGDVTHWNEAAESMFGWCKAETLGRSLHVLFGARPEHAEYFGKGCLAKQEVALAKTFELDVATKSGGKLPVEVSLASTTLESGWYTVGIFRDITARRRTEERLRKEVEERRRMELELRHAQKLEAIGQLASGIAHEINTPTHFVGDGVQFLKDAFEEMLGALSQYRSAVEHCIACNAVPVASEFRAIEEAADLDYLVQNVPLSIERCLNGIARVTAIVHSMKEFAYADQREQHPAELNHAIETTLVIARNEYKYVANIETDLGEIPLVTCHIGDLNQVFLNLIVNAAHAIADAGNEDGTKGTIRIRTRHEGDQVRIDVTDSGSGIPESVRSRIFEPFFTTKPVGKGTGQGLAIARTIVVNKHAGSLTFESEVGRGTTFTILLPIEGRPPGTSTSPVSRQNPGVHEEGP